MISHSRASRLDSRCPRDPAGHLVSLSAFLLSLLFATKTLSYIFQISVLQKQLSHFSGNSFAMCDHTHLVSSQKEL